MLLVTIRKRIESKLKLARKNLIMAEAVVSTEEGLPTTGVSMERKKQPICLLVLGMAGSGN